MISRPSNKRNSNNQVTHWWFTIKVITIMSQILVNFWSIFGQFLVNFWSIFGQYLRWFLVNFWSIFGQYLVNICVDFWSIFGRFFVNFWLIYGQFLDIEHWTFEMKQTKLVFPPFQFQFHYPNSRQCQVNNIHRDVVTISSELVGCY